MRGWEATLVGLGLLIGAIAAPAGAAAANTVADRPWGPDAVFAQLGRAKGTSTFTAGMWWNWQRQWRVGDDGWLSGYNEVSIGHWRADGGEGRAVVTQFGFAPTFRYWLSGQAAGWFAEAAIGVNALTPLYRSGERRFSTAFNFGDHIAVGRRQQHARGWEWSLRLQHFSNAGIKKPNPGEDFLQLRLSFPSE